jgi:hypothetical protein
VVPGVWVYGNYNTGTRRKLILVRRRRMKERILELLTQCDSRYMGTVIPEGS